ncbi:hypothetical protein [Ferrimonas marina]|uniref:Protein FliT n=1 Tax=Ferrimonas marina TaxID=299255 RepID=A0A1M5QVF4_9GAMM|nr:hypothetical protein [Ferrimonas marina]SHH17513.1 hypothetical protein SAMN02745129_1357 [Ferrimonas marina]
MSVKAGKTLPEAGAQARAHQWQKLAKAMTDAAQGKDWPRLAQLDLAMRKALEQSGRPLDDSERQARQQLERVHNRLRKVVEAERVKLERKLVEMRETKEGLSAYELTVASGERG